jgi:PAS domain S-box-containing protein
LSQPTSVNIQFDFGSLNQTILNPLLNTLPIEITFIDDTETVRYFNNPPKMIFLRTKGVIGMKVQNCHPAKSLDTVNKIIQSFKSQRKSTVDFWITSHGQLIYIRFFAVKDASGKYVGTVEVVEDVTDIQNLKGEKRLLDWTD